jgi:hypothetical protein
MSDPKAATLQQTMQKPKRIHKKRDKRLPDPPRMRLTGRDRQIVKAVYEYRVLRQDQIQLLFGMTKTRSTRVLQRLFHHGYLARAFLPVIKGAAPTLYVLDRAGVQLLRSDFGLDTLKWHPTSKSLKGEFLEHTTAINDFRILMTLACEREGYTLTWLGENEIKADIDRVTVRVNRFKTKTVPIVPDSYFLIETPRGDAHFFLELDRATMPTNRFKSKIQGYIAYFENGGFAERYSASDEDAAFRVLTVISGVSTGEKRLNNLKVVTHDAGGANLFWFAIAKHLTPANVLKDDVWIVAGDDTTAHLFN